LAFRISLTAAGLALPPVALHHLADEPADGLRLVLHRGDLIGVVGDDLVDRRLDGAGVGDLLQAALFDDRGRAPSPAHMWSNTSLAIFDETTPSSISLTRAAMPAGLIGEVVDVEAVLGGQAAHQVVDRPVGGQLGVAADHGGLENSARASAISTRAS
jgi:hypothetical protein